MDLFRIERVVARAASVFIATLLAVAVARPADAAESGLQRLFEPFVDIRAQSMDAGRAAALVGIEEIAKRPRVVREQPSSIAVEDIDEDALLEQLLHHAIALEPKKARWRTQLDAIEARMRTRGPSSASPIRESATAHFDRAIASITSAPARAVLLADGARSALCADEDRVARRRADQLLALVSRLDADAAADASHLAHIVLGELALRQGSTVQAAQELMLAAEVTGSEALSVVGPDLQLAQHLLERGRPDVVSGYLGRVSKFWDSVCIPAWRVTIEAGATPDFAARADCRKSP